jgi:dihydroorotate dehydrogenase (NAD+) catalytic subunit
MIDLGRSLTVKNPIFMASGTFGLGDKLPDYYKVAGAFVAKTVTPQARPGNPPPRLVETPSGIINYVGLQNPGIDGYIDLISSIEFPTSFISSVHAVNCDDVIMMIKRIEEIDRVAGYELNLSCPNVAHNSVLPSVDPSLVENIVKTARALTDKWICAKLPPYTCIEVASICQDHGADAVCVSNTFPAIAFTPHGHQLQGGLSGPAVKPMALYNVYQTAKKVTIPIIASGGARTGKCVQEFLSVGAKAVQIGSVNFVEPGAVSRILKEWKELES